MDPVVSVVIPCYAQARFLAGCIASVQAQTYPHWEAIIVNDGSPDDTKSVAEDLVARDSRVRYIERPHSGQPSARNAGLRAARGRWIQFLDADDLLEPMKFELQVARLSTCRQLAFCYCDYWRGEAANPRVRVPGAHPSLEFKLARPVLDMALRWEWDFSIPIHTPLFDRAFFHDLGIHFDETLPNNEDWDVWMQMLRHSPQILYEPAELAIYRQSPASVSRNRDLMWRGFSAAIRKQRTIWADDPEVVKSLELTQRLVDYHYYRSWRSRLRRRLDGSRTYRRNCPWPIQKFFLRLTDRPALPPTR